VIKLNRKEERGKQNAKETLPNPFHQPGLLVRTSTHETHWWVQIFALI